MAKASPALLTGEINSNTAIAAAAAEIHTLINSQPRSPTKDELAAIIAKVASSAPDATPPAALPPLSLEHLQYRKIVAEIERCNDDPDMPDEETDAALSRLQEQASELEAKTWAKPAKTLADILLRAEIALLNENGVMDSLDNPDAYYDDRANAELIRAVLDVLGGPNVL
jgi:hypothetical protein